LTPNPSWKAPRYLTYLGKLAGFVAALDTLPFFDPMLGVVIFAAALLLKDTVNRMDDMLDDGKPNQSIQS
jgi:hypothetical protein